ncbi:acyl-CoA dehydrogenase family protein [Nocardiopsis quinghaiensis]|uniref:acyl-CoA dehydrogenase family protein n=1 Tax=Nocardiopsis quinghaiensis TaxID=464995 RepID=UPI0012398BFD|nr:acyl-CoA dehydrogenase family protein [Nocardiopsis quinghaiensis]
MAESFALNAEFGPVIAGYLEQNSPVEDNRDQGETLPQAWSGLACEIGVVGLLVPDALGGQGAGLVELGTALFEAGRHGWSGPLAAVAGAAVSLLRTVDPDDTSRFQRQIAEQGRVVVPAFYEDATGESLVSTATLREGRVDGRRRFVDSGTHATDLLLVAHEAGEPTLVTVRSDGEGVEVRAQDGADAGRGLASVELTAAPARVIARGGTVEAATRDAWCVGSLLIATDALGAADRAFELAREYAGTREQFGRAIGSFQVVKHKLVDMYAELELARSAVREALRLGEEQANGWREAASAAAALVGDATTHILRESTHVHGGIGFTWEHELSHHFRRVMACRGLYGTPTLHRSFVAAEKGLT